MVGVSLVVLRTTATVIRGPEELPQLCFVGYSLRPNKDGSYFILGWLDAFCSNGISKVFQLPLGELALSKLGIEVMFKEYAEYRLQERYVWVQVCAVNKHVIQVCYHSLTQQRLQVSIDVSLVAEAPLSPKGITLYS